MILMIMILILIIIIIVMILTHKRAANTNVYKHNKPYKDIMFVFCFFDKRNFYSPVKYLANVVEQFGSVRLDQL